MNDVQPQNNQTQKDLPTSLQADEIGDAILARWEDAEKPSEPETEDEPEIAEEEETNSDTQEETVEDEVDEDEETDPEDT